MRIFNSKRGSVTVEAALIVPLIFIVVFGLISIALTYYKRIYEQSQTEMRTAYPEDIVRARRLCNNIYSSDYGDSDVPDYGDY